MTDEDRTAAKLRGKNCLIKFKDGEELMFYAGELDGDEDDKMFWLQDVEKYLNGSSDIEYFPAAGIALSRDSIKYVISI